MAPGFCPGGRGYGEGSIGGHGDPILCVGVAGEADVVRRGTTCGSECGCRRRGALPCFDGDWLPFRLVVLGEWFGADCELRGVHNLGLEHQSTLEGGAVGGVVGDGEGAAVEVVVVAGADDFASRVGPLDVGGLAKCGNHFYEGVHVGSRRGAVQAGGCAEVEAGVGGVGDEGEVDAVGGEDAFRAVLGRREYGVFASGAKHRHGPSRVRGEHLLRWPGVLRACDDEAVQRVFGYASAESHGVVAVLDLCHHGFSDCFGVFAQECCLCAGKLGRVCDVAGSLPQLFDALFAQAAHHLSLIHI